MNRFAGSRVITPMRRSLPSIASVSERRGRAFLSERQRAAWPGKGPGRALLGVCLVIGLAGTTVVGTALATPTVPSILKTRPKKWLWFLYGERIEWSLQWRGAEGGKARLAVGDPSNSGDKTLVVVRADAATTGLAKSLKAMTEEVQSVLDIVSTLPVQTETRASSGKKKMLAKVTRKSDGLLADVAVERDGLKSGGEQSLPARAHDVLSALALLRSLPSLKEGSTRTITIFTGLKTWRTTGTYKGREVRQTALGEMEVFRVDGSAVRAHADGQPLAGKTPKTFTAYFSADRRRVPVLIRTDTDYGEVTMVVSQYAGR